MRQATPPCPWWASVVAVNRELFRGCALCTEASDPGKVFLLLWASQSPQSASFIALHRQPVEHPDFEAMSWAAVSDLHFNRKWYALGDHVSHSDVGFGEDDDLFVVPR
eukprot:9046664-Alexandrium_andersonii.AAC.1